LLVFVLLLCVTFEDFSPYSILVLVRDKQQAATRPFFPVPFFASNLACTRAAAAAFASSHFLFSSFLATSSSLHLLLQLNVITNTVKPIQNLQLQTKIYAKFHIHCCLHLTHCGMRTKLAWRCHSGPRSRILIKSH